MSTDEITLTMPRERPFYGVAHLVLGGVAARLDLTVEHLEELELALDGLLDRRDGGTQVTLTLHVTDANLRAELGPFGEKVRADLESEPGEGVSLRRLLDAVVDEYGVEDRAGATWVVFGKRIGTNGA